MVLLTPKDATVLAMQENAEVDLALVGGGANHVKLKKDCAHISFVTGEGDAMIESGDIAKFEMGKFGKTRKYKNKERAFAWCMVL